jgi:Ca2+-binding RTX toxin-like protein
VTHLIGFEGPAGRSLNDRLTGDSGEGQLFGLAGIGNLIGGGGAGDLEPGTGADLIDGGEGDDAVGFGEARSAVIVTPATGTATGGGINASLTILLSVFGTNCDDHITGDAAKNLLLGKGDKDTLLKGDGDAAIFWDLRNDSVSGGAWRVDLLLQLDSRGSSRPHCGHDHHRQLHHHV